MLKIQPLCDHKREHKCRHYSKNVTISANTNAENTACMTLRLNTNADDTVV